MRISLEVSKSVSRNAKRIIDLIISCSFFFSDSHEYDLIVIGGGSGGLACSKEGVKSLILSIERINLCLLCA